MESSRTTFVPEVGLHDDGKPPMELSLVEIAERLERVTAAIESERARERDARREYQEVATEVEGRIAAIRQTARALLEEQHRRMASFDGMIGRNGNGNGGARFGEVKHAGAGVPSAAEVVLSVATPLGMGSGRSGRLNICEAVLKVWSLDKYRSPLTTSEIARAIKDVGYVTRAAPRSMKSTLNQALAKLCRDRLVRRFRTDGTEISPEDHHSRARKYMAYAAVAELAAAPSENAA